MRVRVTGAGIFGAKGEVAIGTEFNVSGELPETIASRVMILEGHPSDDSVFVTGSTGYAIQDNGRGWYVVTLDGVEVTKSLRADDLEEFEASSAEDKAAFVELNKKED